MVAAEEVDGGTAPAPAVIEAPAAVPNYTLTYRRDHPGGGALGRCSYGIAGVNGIVVFDYTLFADGKAPATIMVDVPLAQPKPDLKEAKAAAAAQKLIDRAAKATAKIEAAKVKALERQVKADAALAAAKAKIEAATKAAAAPASA
jgi:hypothetical protein